MEKTRRTRCNFAQVCRLNMWEIRNAGVMVRGRLVKWVFESPGVIDRTATIAAAWEMHHKRIAELSSR